MSEVNSREDEELEIDESPDEEITENEDGSVNLVLDDDSELQANSTGEFLENLAESLPDTQLTQLSRELIDLIEIDKESRTKRDEQYAEGLKRTGLGDEAPGGATFDGASTVVHPVLAEACVDYSASMMKEIFPADGPVRIHTPTSNEDPALLEKAENKRDFLNWQLTKQMPEYRANLEIVSTQQPLGGSQFLKFIYDEDKKRPYCEFIPIDRVYLPFSATSFYTTPRLTLSISLTEYEYARRVKSGMYRDIDVSGPSFMPDETESEKAIDAIEGKSADAYNEDGLREIYEVYAYRTIEDEDDELPYIISIDVHSEKVLSIYRNWDEQDEQFQKLDWIVEWSFIPWRGAYGIGLAHLIGGLTASATGALRALLDSAHINNFPGAVRLKGAGRQSGQNISINPTEVAEIEQVTGVDDIRKTIMGLPFNPPSPVLFQLLGFVVEAARGVVSVAEEKIADASNQMPVGTALALIEQGSKVFSSIHARQHVAQEKALEIICRLNAQNYDPSVQERQFGRVIVPQEDFLVTGNIRPVSDPNIFSEAQRYAQIQGVLQISQDPSVPWNKQAIYKRLLRVMHVDNPNELLPDAPEPVSADPITEIVAAMSGQQIRATPDMPHMVHIQEQLSFILDPVFGAANPVNMNPGFAMILADIQQHMLFMFQQMKLSAIQQAQGMVQQGLIQQLAQNGTPIDPQVLPQIIQQSMADPQVQQQIQLQAAGIFRQQAESMGALVQGLQQAKQLVDQRTPPPPTPPELQIQQQAVQGELQRKSQFDQATLQMQGQEAERRHQLAQAELQLKGQQVQEKSQLSQLELQMEQMQQEFDNRLEQARVQLKAQMDQMAQQVNLQKNREDNHQHMQTEIAKNHEDNQTQLFMEQMRQEGLQQRKELEEHQKEMTDRMDRVVELILAQVTTSPAGRNGSDGESTGE